MGDIVGGLLVGQVIIFPFVIVTVVIVTQFEDWSHLYAVVLPRKLPSARQGDLQHQPETAMRPTSRKSKERGVQAGQGAQSGVVGRLPPV